MISLISAETSGWEVERKCIFNEDFFLLIYLTLVYSLVILSWDFVILFVLVFCFELKLFKVIFGNFFKFFSLCIWLKVSSEIILSNSFRIRAVPIQNNIFRIRQKVPTLIHNTYHLSWQDLAVHIGKAPASVLRHQALRSGTVAFRYGLGYTYSDTGQSGIWQNCAKVHERKVAQSSRSHGAP
jgi:hypothetical protein